MALDQNLLQSVRDFYRLQFMFGLKYAFLMVKGFKKISIKLNVTTHRVMNKPVQADGDTKKKCPHMCK